MERAVLIGHSMGTQVALEAYRAAPERVTALILICGTYGRVTSTFHDSDVLERLLPHLSELTTLHGPLVRALWGRVPAKLAYLIGSWIGEIDGRTLHRDDFVDYVEHLATMDPDVYFRMLSLAGEHSAEDLLPNIRVPTLVIAGELDTFTPCRLARRMATEIPGAEYFEVIGGTHSTPAERPTTVNERIDHFMAALASQGSP
jgi:pimeloyl-ACP methyl ester carboxylesterase